VISSRRLRSPGGALQDHTRESPRLLGSSRTTRGSPWASQEVQGHRSGQEEDAVGEEGEGEARGAAP
jgi:hypothetical protein